MLNGIAGRWIAVALATGGLAACSAPPRAPQASAATPGWVMTPLVDGVERQAGGLMLAGAAAPDGRVVVRGPAGVAYATSADAQGRFALRIDAPREPALFLVETQIGQEAVPAPYRLLISPDVAGPIALLTPGGPSRRLDPAGPLDVVDGDGRTALASGRATPRAVIAVSSGGASLDVQTQPDGRWVVPLTPGAGDVGVGAHRYVLPALPRGDQAGLSVSQDGAGRRVAWTTPDGAAQVSWFPDRG